jgi:MFS family permease
MAKQTEQSQLDGNSGSTLGKAQWLVLVAAFLGWMFDGVEMGLFPIVAPPALRDLLQTSDRGAIGAWNGVFAAVFLLGAAAGGLLFGWLGDKLGRVRSMAISITAYSVFTGACFFAADPWQLAALRFTASLAMGGEWALGVALVMECWPERHRPILAGAIGAANNLGIVLIAVVGMIFPVTAENWRWMMLSGLAPALLAVFVIGYVPESERWKTSAKAAKSRPIREVLSPPLLRNTLVAVVLCTVMMTGTWAAATSFGPLWAEELAGTPRAKAVFQVVMSGGAMLGCLIGPLLAKAMGRRLAYFLCAASSLASCQVLFRTFAAYDAAFLVMSGIMGVCVVSFFGLVPLYLPELYPTRVRATGQGIAFNFGRFLAAGGAYFSGRLVGIFDGDYAAACAAITLIYLVGMIAIWLAPETRGRPLPE